MPRRPAHLPITLCLIQLLGAILVAFATWSSIKSILLTAPLLTLLGAVIAALAIPLRSRRILI